MQLFGSIVWLREKLYYLVDLALLDKIMCWESEWKALRERWMFGNILNILREVLLEFCDLSQLMRLWYLSHRWTAKALRSLARAFAVRTYEVWKETKGLTKNQTSSSTGWLRMCVWRMSLWRMKSAIISWDGSFNFSCLASQFWDHCKQCRPRSDTEECSVSSRSTLFAQLSCDMIKPTKWVCAQRSLRSAWASTQSDQSLRCVLSG